MPFGDNSQLLTGATLVDIASNMTNDVYLNDTTDTQASAFSFCSTSTARRRRALEPIRSL